MQKISAWFPVIGPEKQDRSWEERQCFLPSLTWEWGETKVKFQNHLSLPSLPSHLFFTLSSSAQALLCWFLSTQRPVSLQDVIYDSKLPICSPQTSKGPLCSQQWAIPKNQTCWFTWEHHNHRLLPPSCVCISTKKKKFFLRTFQKWQCKAHCPFLQITLGPLKPPRSLRACSPLVSRHQPPGVDTEGTPALIRSRERYPEEVAPMHWLWL